MDIMERIRGWCIDWNGAPMMRGEPPRDGLHCDDLLDAADEIERLRAIASQGIQIEHKLRVEIERLRKLGQS